LKQYVTPKRRQFLPEYTATYPRKQELHLKSNQIWILSGTAALELKLLYSQEQILQFVSFHENNLQNYALRPIIVIPHKLNLKTEYIGLSYTQVKMFA
jgi:hypothetical protein